MPRFVFGEFVEHAWKAVRAWLRRRLAEAAEQEMLLIYSVGCALESCRDFLDHRGPAAHAVAQRFLKKLT